MAISLTGQQYIGFLYLLHDRQILAKYSLDRKKPTYYNDVKSFLVTWFQAAFGVFLSLLSDGIFITLSKPSFSAAMLPTPDRQALNHDLPMGDCAILNAIFFV